jgi:hypothetical protein
METYEHDDINIHDITDIDDFTAGRIVQKMEDEAIGVGRGNRLDVYTKDCVDEATAEYIKGSLFAFSAGFLACETGLPEKAFEVLQEMCEDANEPIEAMIDATCGMDCFVESAIGADGYGHFLASYDGHEESFDVDGQTYYVFRN